MATVYKTSNEDRHFRKIYIFILLKWVDFDPIRPTMGAEQQICFGEAFVRNGRKTYVQKARRVEFQRVLKKISLWWTFTHPSLTPPASTSSNNEASSLNCVDDEKCFKLVSRRKQELTQSSNSRKREQLENSSYKLVSLKKFVST